MNKITIFGIVLIVIGLGLTVFMVIGLSNEYDNNGGNFEQADFEFAKVLTEPGYAILVGGIIACILGLSFDKIEEIKYGKKKKEAPQSYQQPQQPQPPYNP